MHCSTPVPDDATFCHRCGSVVSGADGQAAITAALGDSGGRQLELLLREATKGEFEIEKLLGKGGMALVYLATETHLDRKVAIKVLPPELTFGHGVERFKREAKTAAALDHAHIIPIHRIGSSGKLFWYAMKFVEGDSLEDYLKDKTQLPLDETVNILKPVADALDYAHENKVIHRDIKPANVMLDERGRVTVADFGIAKALTESTLTASGSVVGTPYYMSPEQGMGKTVGGASDQYSVAVMAFRMLSGQVPFDGESAIDILHKHCTLPPPRLEGLRSDLPKFVHAAVHKALGKKPEERFSSVSAFVAGLEEMSPEISAELPTVVMDSDPSIQDRISTEVISTAEAPTSYAPTPTPVTPQPTAPPTTQPEQKKSRVPVIVIGAFMATIVVAIGWWFTMGPRSGNWVGAAAPVEDTTQTTSEESQVDPNDIDVYGTDALEDPVLGLVSITGLPTGGTVSVDGQVRNGTEFELEPGSYTVILGAPGYESQETDITVADDGSSITVAFTGQEVVEEPQETARQPDPPVVQTVRVALDQPFIYVGDSTNARISVIDQYGNELRGRPVNWVSANQTAATITARGQIRGVGQGASRISATVDGVRGSIDINVRAVAVAAVRVEPRDRSLTVGETLGFQATVLDANNRDLGGRAVTWASSDRSVATVSSTGVVSAHLPGATTISATSGGQTGSSSLTVKAEADVLVREREGQREVTPSNPQPPSGPEDLFSGPVPDGWILDESAREGIAKYDHRELGIIRIVEVTGENRRAILGEMAQMLRRRMTLRELGEYQFRTGLGEQLLIRRFRGSEGDAFSVTEWDVVAVAARNDERLVGIIGQFILYADPERATDDLMTMLQMLR